ncbi:N-acetyltransferase B complex non catalytic subunit-domain-containing protein [Jackrogersella minutella]|nr:N-acetyltransferase B complex non catalytic subunit-domain-containing protein [Jackrogersella minutella]
MAPPPLLKPTPRPCHIKTTAPSNLATAFGEQQWVTAANLAKQRYRTTKDPYYLAVEIAAKSQSDNLTDRNAGKIAVENMVKENVTISDADTLDMYELSCYYLNVKYSETIGVLRGRLVKALPKDQNACTRCFDACVWFSDWKNAQQIAASLNKNFVNDRKFLFRYIMATHLYSTSQDCPDGSRKIFSSLAKAQADKAFDLRVMTAGEEYHVNRAVLTDAEVWLWLDIRIIHSTQKENLELFRRSEYSPLRFLESGQYDLFWKAYKYLQACDASDDIIQIGKHILITATHRFQSEADAIEKDADVINLRKLASAEDNQQSPVEISSVKTKLDRAIAKARPARSSEDNYYVAATCDYQMLFIMLNEIQSQPDNKRLMKQTNNSIDKLTRALKRADCMRPIFQRSLSIVSLAAIFHRDSTPDLALGNPMTTRVTCLVDYINQGFDNPNLLLETLLFIRELSAPEIEACVSSLYNIGTKSADSFKRFMLAALCSKIRYTVAGNPKLATCGFCNTELKGNDCVSCLKGIAIDALDTYKIGIEDHNLRQDILSRQGENPLSDIAITGAACLLRIARLGSKRSSYGTNSLHHANIQLFLQAVLWLDSCTRTSLPIKSVHSIILTKLYVILGSVVRAKNLWDPYAVKNVLLDSLGLLFIDRLSSITPGLFIMGTSHSNPVEPFMTHFSRGLRVTTPKRIMDSLEMGNYQSIPGIVQFAKKQAASCSLVLTVVEDRRASRMKTGKIELAIEDQALVRTLNHSSYQVTRKC